VRSHRGQDQSFQFAAILQRTPVVAPLLLKMPKPQKQVARLEMLRLVSLISPILLDVAKKRRDAREFTRGICLQACSLDAALPSLVADLWEV
jgi:hypothetical protein